jgi:hypothetical protein
MFPVPRGGFILFALLILWSRPATGAPANDHLANALPLTTSLYTPVDFEGATTEPFEAQLPIQYPNSGSVWFNWEAPAEGGWFELRSRSDQRRIGYSLFTGPPELRLVAEPDLSGYYWMPDAAPLFPSNGIRFQAAAGATYRIRAHPFGPPDAAGPPAIGVFPASAPAAQVVSIGLPASRVLSGTGSAMPVQLRILSAEKFEGGVLSSLVGVDTNDMIATSFGAEQRISGDEFDGTYLVDARLICEYCTRFRRESEYPWPLIWTVRNVLLATGDWRTNLAQGYPGNLPWPAGTGTTVPLVNALPEDTEAPELVALEVSSAGGGGNHRRLKFRLRDAGFGFLYGGADLVRVGGGGGLGADVLRSSLVQGTPHDGWYEVLIDGSMVPPGHYTINVRAVDGAGNAVSVDSAAPDFPGPFSGEIAWKPELIPDIVEFSVSPQIVDVSAANAVVTVTVVIRDPEEAIAGTDLSFVATSGAPSAGQAFAFDAPEVPGKGQDRLYRFQRTVTIPRSSPAGKYLLNVAIRYAGLRDLLVGSQGMAPPGGTPWLEIINPGTVDNEPAGVEVISAEPVEPWSPVAMGVVNVRLRIHDDRQPLVDPADSLFGTAVWLAPKDSGGNLLNGRRMSILPEHRISGDGLDGIYECRLLCASSGPVRMEMTVRSNASWSTSLLAQTPVIARSANPWLVWTAAWQLAGDEALPQADPDEDGFSNLEEYALGLSPVRRTVDPAPGFPPPSLRYYPASVSGFYAESFGFEFSSFVQPLDAGVRISPEFSTDLVAWLPAPAAFDFYGGWDSARSFRTRKLTAGLPACSASPRYFRIRVELSDQ